MHTVCSRERKKKSLLLSRVYGIDKVNMGRGWGELQAAVQVEAEACGDQTETVPGWYSAMPWTLLELP